MVDRPLWRSLVDFVLSIGEHPSETDMQRGGRQVIVVAALVAAVLELSTLRTTIDAGFTWITVLRVVDVLATFVFLAAIELRPHRFKVYLQVLFGVSFVLPLFETALYGGLMASGLVVIFGVIIVVGAMVAIDLKSAIWWLVAFAASVVYAVLVPDWVDPIYELGDPAGDAAFNLIATGIITLAVMAYFVRQRDRFQAQSDDLLHNILPDEIAARLKATDDMIADHYESASVLFADVVDFTPLSASMSPPELVGFLDEVFTTFDGFVRELGLEKIKTVGDEYMVASGVPEPRPDHAHAVAELALRIRDHVATHRFDGHEIRLRIGINSGPVVAGIIGTHKFAYDLWGDAVNTASRMQSEGVAGSIQVSPSTFELIRDAYVCEARGVVPIKGKGDMTTYFLISRRAEEPTTAGTPRPILD